MKAVAILLILVGLLLELFNVFGLLMVPFNKDAGIGNLIGQYLFNILLTVAGIVCIIIGVKMEKRK